MNNIIINKTHQRLLICQYNRLLHILVHNTASNQFYFLNQKNLLMQAQRL